MLWGKLVYIEGELTGINTKKAGAMSGFCI